MAEVATTQHNIFPLYRIRHLETSLKLVPKYANFQHDVLEKG